MKLSSISKAILATSLLLAAGAACAQNYKGETNYKAEVPSCPPPPVLMDGFYVGAQGGYDSYRVRDNATLPITATTGSNVLNATGGVGGLFVGYGQYFSNFYLGGEVFGNYSGADDSYSISRIGVGTFNSKFQARGSYGLSLLPGVRLSDTLLGYLRVGYNWAYLKDNDNVAGFASNRNRTEGGWSYGLGMESLIWANWSLRGEYTHTKYNSFNTAFSHVDPSDNQFLLGIIYHFA